MAVTRDYNLAKLLTDAGITVDDIVINDAMSVGGNTNIDLGTLFIDSVNNRIGINKTAPTDTLEIDTDGEIVMTRYATLSQSFGRLHIRRSTSATVGVDTAVTNNDQLGGLRLSGYDGSSYIRGCEIVAAIDGTVSTNVLPTELRFYVNTGGSDTTQKMVLCANGNLGIGTATPASVLDVVGTAAISANATFGTDSLFVDTVNDRIGVGITTPTASIHAYGTNAKINIETDVDAYETWRYVNTSNGPFVILNKSRGAGIGNNTIVQDGDDLGGFLFSGADGTGFVRGASIVARVDGTPGTNDMPTEMVFSVTTDGASTETQRMVIAANGNVGIGTATPASLLDVGGEITAQYNIIGDKEGLVVTLTTASGQSFAAGDIGYMASGGVTKADASAEATAKGTLFMATGTIGAASSGLFMRLGVWVTSGLTQGTEYYLSETAGAYTSTRPTTSASIVRVIGTALSTTQLMFDPSGVYVENA